ncbi:MAG: hypothetical protein M3141_04765 [Actinomycetota bacterium]|nr:hypothetical protein [Actinomycetota bacterium]
MGSISRVAWIVPVLVLAGTGTPATAQAPAPGCPPRPGELNCAVRTSVEAGYILAEAFTPRARVQIEARRGGSTILGPKTVRTSSDGNGNVLTLNTRLAAGDEVVATDLSTGTVKRLTIHPITLKSVDVVNDVVSGTARPGDPVNVGLEQGFFQEVPGGQAQVTTDAQGVWRADYRARGVDLTSAMTASASIHDSDNDVTHGDLGAGCPSVNPGNRFRCTLEVHVVNDLFGVQRMSPNSNVELKIFDRRGGQAIYDKTLKTDERGSTPLLEVSFTSDVDLKPGNYATARDVRTGTVKTLEVADVSIDRVDVTTDAFEGSAPPGSLIDTGCNQPLQATAEGSGRWTVDCAAFGYDVDYDDTFAAILADTDSDVTIVNRGAPIPDCVPSPTTICGTAGPEALRTAVPADSALAMGARRGVRKVDAGRGNDVVIVTPRGPRMTVDLGHGREDKAVVRPGHGTVVVRGASRRMEVALPLHPGTLVARVTGTRGADTVTTRRFRRRPGRGGGFRIDGRAGNDTLRGGRGIDLLIGGAGRDTCFVGRGDRVRSCETVRRIA